jgi:hypothetical protein
MICTCSMYERDGKCPQKFLVIKRVRKNNFGNHDRHEIKQVRV